MADAIIPNEPTKRKCNECAGWFVDGFFRRNRRRVPLISGTPDRHPTCKGCEGRRRDNQRKEDIWLCKARTTIRHHAARFNLKPREFIERYVWHPDRVAHLMKHAFDNTCVYCRRLYADMANGPREVTMDIRDPNMRPYLDTNTTPCCASCKLCKREHVA